MMNLAVTFEHDKPKEAKELTVVKLLAENKTTIFHVKSTSSLDEYAVKIFTQNETSLARYNREKQIIACLHHPNIIKYYPISSHNMNSDILITEYARYGDMFGLVKGKYLTQNTHIRTYFYQLIDALEYMHSQHIAHLDIKLENLLIDSDFNLKLADFDQSHSKEEKLNCLGTNSYRPPEILEKNCKDIFAADIYSAGIVLFALKAGQFPFVEFQDEGETRIMSYDLFMEDNEKFWKVKAKKLRKNESFFSKDFKDLLKGMLQKDPAKRFTIADIKASEWYNQPVLSQELLKAHMSRSCFGFVKDCEERKSKKFTSTLCSILSPFHKSPSPTQSIQGTPDISEIISPMSTNSTRSSLDHSSNKKSNFSIWTCWLSKKKTNNMTANSLSPYIEKQSTLSSIRGESGYHKRAWSLDLRPLNVSALKPINEDDSSKINVDLNSQAKFLDAQKGSMILGKI